MIDIERDQRRVCGEAASLRLQPRHFHRQSRAGKAEIDHLGAGTLGRKDVFRDCSSSLRIIHLQRLDIGIAYNDGSSPAPRWQVPADGMGGLIIAASCLGLLALHWLEQQLLTRRAAVLICRHDGTFLRALFAAAAIWLLLLPKVQGNPFIYFRF